jgi:hypothetical protein
LLSIDAASQEDSRRFKQKRTNQRNKLGGSDNEDIKSIDPLQDDPESSLYSILPTFTPELESLKQDEEMKTIE